MKKRYIHLSLSIYLAFFTLELFVFSIFYFSTIFSQMNNKGKSSSNGQNDSKVSWQIYPAKEQFSKPPKDSSEAKGWDDFPYVGGCVSCTLILPLILAASSFACNLFSKLATYDIVIGETGKWKDLAKHEIKDLNPIPDLMYLYIGTLALTFMILVSSCLSKSKRLFKAVGWVSFVLLLAAIAFSSHICLLLNKNLIGILKASNISEENLITRETRSYRYSRYSEKHTYSTERKFSFESDIHGVTQVSAAGINLFIASIFFTVVSFTLHSLGLVSFGDTKEEGKEARRDNVDI